MLTRYKLLYVERSMYPIMWSDNVGRPHRLVNRATVYLIPTTTRPSQAAGTTMHPALWGWCKTTHTEIVLCALVERWSGAGRWKDLTQACTDNIITFSWCYRTGVSMSSTGRSPCKAKKLKNGGKTIPRFTFSEVWPSSAMLGGPCQRRLAWAFCRLRSLSVLLHSVCPRHGP